MTLKEYELRKNKHEIIAAVGKLPNVKKRIGIISTYIPPRLSALQRKKNIDFIEETIERLKKEYREPLILVGGDFNQTSIVPLLEKFPDVEEVITDATQKGRTLDKILINLTDTKLTILSPLETDCGQHRSNHRVIYLTAQVTNVDNFKKRTISHTCYTEEGKNNFLKLMLNTDWEQEFSKCGEESTDMVEVMNLVLEDYVNQSFKTVQRTVKDTDPPWITSSVKRAVKRRKRIFAANQKRNAAWKAEKVTTNKLIVESKKRYLDNQVSKLAEEGSHTIPYRAIKNLKTSDMPKQWDIRDLRPGKSDEEIAEELSDYFNSISREFVPLTQEDICLLYTSPSPRDRQKSRMPSSA